MKAVIRNYRNITNPTVVATIKHENGEVTIESSVDYLQEMLERGIMGRNEVVYTKKDGDNFVRELPYAFSGSILRAEIVR